MIEENMRWIRGIANQLYYQYVEGTDHELRVRKEDLIQQGIIGCMKAGRDFDPVKSREGGKRFYIRIRVTGEMKDYLRKLPLIRVPQEQWDKVKQVREVETDLAVKGEDVTLSSLSLMLGWPELEVERVRGLRCKIEFYDRTLKDDTGDYWQMLPKDQKTPETLVMENEIADIIQLCLKRLDNKKRLIIQLRYLDRCECTLGTLASRFQISAERVRQIEGEAFGKMKKCLKNNGVDLNKEEG